MKALTFWQPWASLITAGAKPYEFRGWRPPASIIGQRIVIHAGTRLVKRGEVDQLRKLLEYGGRPAAMTCLRPDEALPVLRQPLTQYYCGVGLGTAIVGEPKIGTAVAEEFGVSRANDSDRDAHANWGWPMLEIEVWREPVAARGMQGLWEWQGGGLTAFVDRL